MHPLDNRVAGENVNPVAAFSDGIFAVAMTPLVLDLRVPAGEDQPSVSWPQTQSLD
jgi:uncharacterized membrane protein